jgi:hypothetical protein
MRNWGVVKRQYICVRGRTLATTKLNYISVPVPMAISCQILTNSTWGYCKYYKIRDTNMGV